MATNVTVSSTIPTKWKRELLKTADGYLVADIGADTQIMGRGEGNTVRCNRLLRPAKVTATATPGSLITASSAKDLTANYIDYNMEIWQDVFKINDDVDIQSFLGDKSYQDVIARQMGNSIDAHIMDYLATQGIRHRVDNDSTYEVSGTVDSGTTTTALIDSALDQAADFWNGGYVGFTNPEGGAYDEVSEVTDFVATTDTATMAVTNTPTKVLSNYVMTVGTGLVAADKLSSAAIMRVSARHEFFQTEKFEGGMFKMFIHPAQHADFWTDEDFKLSAIHDSHERFKTFKLINWFDHQFIVSSNVRREDADGTKNDAGAVYISPSFGKHAYNVIRYGNPGGQGKFAVRMEWIDAPDSGNLTRAQKFFIWKGTFAAGVKRGTSVINLMTGATSLNVVG